ncbi:hypothetical protein Vretimale_17244 [Volvox reticuliferus]|uniref:UTP-monosaccharide-1-phosphate uridylyltransferase n=1 Tax=Volvox reticuliferus TaxID=1737510 RepID=A0A8J4CX94_9CHLO|nr:hypothetical protein Vretifemale_16565 [Volvox reticuliferus]GIM14212.1 hypothetical protein Vretimale_17244 [Volvox reticuliferus]
MVRRGAILFGVGATVAVGGLGYIAYQFRRSTSIPTGEDSSNVPLEASALPAARDAPTVTSTVIAPTDNVQAVLKGNAVLLKDQDRVLVSQLLDLGQAHLFEGWPDPGTDDESKRRMLDQLRILDASYHGGIAAYVRNARKLLQESRDGINPFEGYVPSVPTGATLDFASLEFMELEGEGLREAGHAAFVLVAGGLGERLGYSGIKVALPCESATCTPFLGLYIASILALQARAGNGRRLPLAIMTSDDTHGRTLELLRKNNYFGMDEDQITLLKQEKVACLIDNAAHLALEPTDRFSVQTKPHGHGDVHMLLAKSGLAAQWLQSGLTWVCFFQDTNALVFRALLAALGVSARNNFDMNSLAVPRKAREAIGAITRLTRPDGSAPLTINVEYNQLDPLLRSTISKEGDVNDASGYSPFPGNINQLVLKLSSYVPQLAATGGVISEFVNPKYKDSTKTTFKSSTRLECMMQDYPKALPSTAKVGFTTIKQVWASYSPVKNSPADAAAKFKEGNPTHSATTGELDIYKANCLSLAEVAGVALPSPLQTDTFNGITTEVYPRVVLSPAFSPSLSELKAKVAPGSITLAPDSVLVLDGPNITVRGPLVVRGALVVRAVAGATVELGQLTVDNAGWIWEPLEEGESASEEDCIRGFKVVRKATMELVYDKPGSYVMPAPMQQLPTGDADSVPTAEPETVSGEGAGPALVKEVEVSATPVAQAMENAEELSAAEIDKAQATEDDSPTEDDTPAEVSVTEGRAVLEAAAASGPAAPTVAATMASSSCLSAAAKPFVPSSISASLVAAAAATPAAPAAPSGSSSKSKSSKRRAKAKAAAAAAASES